MNNSLIEAVQQIIQKATGPVARVVDTNSLSGGCINNAQIIRLSDGRRFFVKSSTVNDDRFQVEADGLNAIAQAGAIAVPKVIGHGADDGGARFLVLEAIVRGQKKKNFSVCFARQLARMHQSSAAKFGYPTDNYLGSTPQPNAWSSDWCQFFRERRIGFQWKLARQNGFVDPLFNRSCHRLLDRLDQWPKVDEPPALIHGDLWSGNIMVGPTGHSVLIDPAVYYAHREAEFGMTTLFGGLDEKFYDAYREVWPLQPGSQERIEIYRLYHLLNHLNLFGTSYLAGCLDILKKYT